MTIMSHTAKLSDSRAWSPSDLVPLEGVSKADLFSIREVLAEDVKERKRDDRTLSNKDHEGNELNKKQQQDKWIEHYEI